MKQRLLSLFASLSIVVATVLVFAAPVAAAPTTPGGTGGNGAGATSGTSNSSSNGGVNVFNDACSGATTSGGAICGANDSGKGLPDLLKVIINTMIFLVGTIAVVMIVIGGVKYVVSNGEASQLQSAKNTVLYSVIGLVIAISAFAIVNFVLDKFK
jgi:hypothetical protein